MSLIHRTAAVSLLLLLALVPILPIAGARCRFRGIFNFGDSNSDTGGFWAAFPPLRPPFGMTYFKRPAGRGTDGRVFIDFLAQAIGLPFLSPYLQSIGSRFQHGANFATAASTVLKPNTSVFVSGISPFYLGVQLSQMIELRRRVLQGGSQVKNVQAGKASPGRVMEFWQGGTGLGGVGAGRTASGAKADTPELEQAWRPRGGQGNTGVEVVLAGQRSQGGKGGTGTGEKDGGE